MYTINKPKELTKVTKLNAEEIFLADNTYYIKCIDTFYSVDKLMLKKLSFGDKTGLCIKAYRELEDMQLLTIQGITTVKGFKVIEAEEVRDIKEELEELIVDKPEVTKDSPVTEKSLFDYTEEELDEIFDSKIEFKKEMDHLDIEWEKEFTKQINKRDMYCPSCCGTCLDCPYIGNSNGDYDYEFFLRWG